MKSRCLCFRFFAALPAVLVPLLLVPTAHAEGESLSGKWEKGRSEFAKRQVKDASPGTLEDDKDVEDHGGQTTFNVTNMEVKCKAIRGDGEETKTARGQANFEQFYVWQKYGTNDPPSPYFKIISIQDGTECHASPLRKPEGTAAEDQIGLAEGTGDFGSANNRSDSAKDLKSNVPPKNDVIIMML